MIRVTIEIWPGGFPGGSRKLAWMNIANISDLSPVSDYEADIWEAPSPFTHTKAREWSLLVRGHARQQGVLALLAAVLDQARREGFVSVDSGGEGSA